MSNWQPGPAARMDDATLAAVVERVFQEMLEEHFSDGPSLNTDLPIQLRALRDIEGWRSLLLLTPWMLCRLLFPPETADLDLPEGYDPASHGLGTERFELLGPIIEFSLLDSKQKAHPSFQVELGGFLIQPLILNMQPFSTPDEAFGAWNKIIRTRDENRKRLNAQSVWQDEISRHELFARQVRTEA
ncbi:MAG: [NiFe]-hydrogenase assembly chaperone HybE [Gammaproteobacteria bacterium]|nr:[NiFe]-hydrogenase assembly chaperone HybE [Gammaproteobacteria bacterium]MBU1656173.1 [NiFe]-hydrogenase assembly chaperone HybE [Gammaproteobacteria bacterium]MBU1961306.1 [NiFe]-hydrogenase assembly chaperone HybE [Gammaproteobacteria bacterium]